MLRKRRPCGGVGVIAMSFVLVLGLASVAWSANENEKPVVEVKTIQPNPNPTSRQAVLRIACHWKHVKNPSIVLLLQLDSKVKLQKPLPIRFQGDVEALVATSIGASEELKAPFKGSVDLLDRASFDVLAWKNCLDKVGGCVAGYIERGGSNVAAEAAYFALNRWAIDDSTLQIEPPGEYFRKEGTMQVLFLDGANTVWQTSVTWPQRSALSEK